MACHSRGDCTSPPSCTLLHSLEGHAAAVLGLTFTRNGQYIMTASQDRSLRLWNPTKGVHVKTYSGPHNHEVNDVVVAESNTKFASCGGDKHFFLWDVSTGQVIRKFVGHDRKVNSLAYGPNEEVLISASHDKTVRVWDLRARSRTPIQIMDEAKETQSSLAAWMEDFGNMTSAKVNALWTSCCSQ